MLLRCLLWFSVSPQLRCSRMNHGQAALPAAGHPEVTIPFIFKFCCFLQPAHASTMPSKHPPCSPCNRRSQLTAPGPPLLPPTRRRATAFATAAPTSNYPHPPAATHAVHATATPTRACLLPLIPPTHVSACRRAKRSGRSSGDNQHDEQPGTSAAAAADAGGPAGDPFTFDTACLSEHQLRERAVKAEQCLRVCTPAMFRLLPLDARRNLRLVSRTDRAMADAQVTGLEWEKKVGER